MTKNSKVVSLAGIVAAILVTTAVIGRDLLLRRSGTFDCGDGPRRVIDIRDFATQYAAYSVELEASVAGKARLSTKLNPIQLQQLSEAIQNAREFRKYTVAGYNSCALSKTQYGQFGARFQALDNLAREINELAGKPSLSQDQTTRLASLITQYGELTQKLGTD